MNKQIYQFIAAECAIKGKFTTGYISKKCQFKGNYVANKKRCERLRDDLSGLTNAKSTKKKLINPPKIPLVIYTVSHGYERGDYHFARDKNGDYEKIPHWKTTLDLTVLVTEDNIIQKFTEAYPDEDWDLIALQADYFTARGKNEKEKKQKAALKLIRERNITEPSELAKLLNIDVELAGRYIVMANRECVTVKTKAGTLIRAIKSDTSAVLDEQKQRLAEMEANALEILNKKRAEHDAGRDQRVLDKFAKLRQQNTEAERKLKEEQDHLNQLLSESEDYHKEMQAKGYRYCWDTLSYVKTAKCFELEHGVK